MAQKDIDHIRKLKKNIYEKKRKSLYNLGTQTKRDFNDAALSRQSASNFPGEYETLLIKLKGGREQKKIYPITPKLINIYWKKPPARRMFNNFCAMSTWLKDMDVNNIILCYWIFLIQAIVNPICIAIDDGKISRAVNGNFSTCFENQ